MVYVHGYKYLCRLRNWVAVGWYTDSQAIVSVSRGRTRFPGTYQVIHPMNAEDAQRLDHPFNNMELYLIVHIRWLGDLTRTEIEYTLIQRLQQYITEICLKSVTPSLQYC
jgi:hypothetical protein